ncbi:branched-chain amino acid ABC transporter permease [Paradesulfitobacterium aromaticivorans]
MKKQTFLLFIALGSALAVFPWLAPAYPLSILTEILIFGLFAAGLNLLIGYTGLVSFGHAAFFGFGAYTAAIISSRLTPNIFLTLTAAILLSVVASLIIGLLVTRASGFYFLMLTLAFSQMVYAAAYQWESLTGGSNGFSGIARPELWPGFTLSGPVHLYYLILIVFALVMLGLRRFLASPVGKVLIGIRENEARLQAVGYNTKRYKLLSFTVAGGIGGIAGALYSYFNGFISPGEIYWTMSGHAIIMVIIGGAGTLSGPVLGAAFLILFQSFVSSYTERWASIVGLAFILFVIFAPKGIMGLFSSLPWRKLTDKLKMRAFPKLKQGREQA